MADYRLERQAEREIDRIEEEMADARACGDLKRQRELAAEEREIGRELEEHDPYDGDRWVEQYDYHE